MNNWSCPKCHRIFQKKGQVHSCKSYPIELHFKNKPLSKELYNHLLNLTKKNVGECKEISLPCCIHWFGTYDFIAILPKKDKLEIRFTDNEKIKSTRIFQTVPLSSEKDKICLHIQNKEDIDEELLTWLKKAYELNS